jgi:hypothetical protein
LLSLQTAFNQFAPQGIAKVRSNNDNDWLLSLITVLVPILIYCFWKLLKERTPEPSDKHIPSLVLFVVQRPRQLQHPWNHEASGWFQMDCSQCGQTLNRKECHEIGVFGKTPEVAAVQVGL